MVSWLLAKDANARPQSARQLICVLTGVEGIPAQRKISAQGSVDGSGSSKDESGVVVSTRQTAWAGLTTPALGQPSQSGRRQKPIVAVVCAIAVISVAGAVAAVAISRPGATPSPSQAARLTGGPKITIAPQISASTARATGASIASEPSGDWLPVGSIPDQQQLWGNGLVQLPDGRVAVFSAENSRGVATLDTWILDPGTGVITGGPAMASYQSEASVGIFDGGSAMIAGGWKNGKPIADAEILDAATGSFKAVERMLSPRVLATVTDIGDRRVLVAGGWSNYDFTTQTWTATATAEIFDRNSGTWSWAAPMSTARAMATATRLADGRVLVAGGDESQVGNYEEVLPSAEIYDPATNSWQPADDMSVPRAAGSAALLTNGHVLVTGGWSDGSEYGLTSTDEYVPGAGWREANAMPDAHAQARLVTLADGRLLEVAGVGADGNCTATTDIYDPATGVWQQTGYILHAEYWPAVTALRDGRVLLVGGRFETTLSGQIQIYSPPPL